MPKPKPLVKIYAAAFYFSHISRDLEQIAAVFSVSTDAVRKWAKTDDWEHALSTLGYQGERKFRRKPTRDTPRENAEVFDTARQVYLQALQDGEPQHKLATIAGNAVGLPRRRIHAWAMKYRWREVCVENDTNKGEKQ